MKAAWNIARVTALLALAAFATPLSAQETVKEGAGKVKDGVVEGAKAVGQKTKEGVSKTGEVITDGWITTRVRQRFMGERLLKDSDINVDTSRHVVILKGRVTNAAGRRRARSIAIQTEGVRRVVNRLTIGPKKD